MTQLFTKLVVFVCLCALTSTQLFAQCGVGNPFSSSTLPANSGVVVAGPCDYGGEYTPWTEVAASPQTYNVVVCNSVATANPAFTNSPWVEVRDNADNLLNSGYADCTGAGMDFTSNGAGPYKISTWDGNTCGTPSVCSYTQVECLTCPAAVCNIGSTLNGAGTVSGTTLGSGNNSLLRASEDYIVQVNLPSAGNWTFSLCNGSSFDTYLYLGTTCGAGNIASNDDGCAPYSTITSNLAAGTYFVTIEAFGATTTGAFTLTVVAPPTCPAPTALTASGLTASAATLSWTAGGTETAWNLEWGATGFTQGTGTLVSGLSAASYSASGFSSCTAYQYYVQADCGGATGTSTWAGPFSFTTFCPCITDYTLNGAGTITGTTLGAGNDCTLRDSEDVTIEVVVPTDGNWTFSLCGSAFDTYLYLGTTCCLGDIASNDDACGLQSSVTTNVTAGTYYVTVEGFSATGAGAFTFTLSPPPAAPANDDCAGAVSVTQNETCTNTDGTVLGSTASADANTCGGTANDDVWYSFTATTANPTIAVNMAFDGVVELLTGSCGSLTSVGCADNNFGTGLEAIAASGLTVGQTYYVRVYSWSSAAPTTPTFTICVYGTPECIGDYTLNGPGTVSGTTVGSGNDCTLRGSEDVTIEVVVPTDGNWTFSLCGSAFDTYLYLGTTCCLGDIASNDDACGLQSSVTTNVTAGTYYVTVEAFGTTTTGDFTFTLSPPPTAPANDDCLGAEVLAQNASCVNTAGTIGGSTDSGITNTCGGSSADDVWYSFVATTEDPIIELNATFDAVLELMSGGCGGLTSVACADNNFGTGLEAISSTGLTIGATYYVRAYSWSTATQINTAFDICVHDNSCTTDLSVTAPGSWTGTTVGAGNDCLLRPSEEIIYEVTIPTDGTWIVDLCGSTYDTYLYIGTECCTGDIASNDDFCGLQSSITTALTAGTYYVTVEGFGTASAGDYTLNINPFVPAVNDECLNAEFITQSSTCNPTTGTILGASQSLAPIDCEGFLAPTANDVWYSFIPTTDNPWVVIEPGFAAQAEVLTGGCGGLTSVACGNNFTGVLRIETAGLTIGQTYYVRLWNYNAAYLDPSFTICVQDAPAAPANDDCINAEFVTQAATCNPTSGTLLASTASPQAVPCFGSADDDVWYSFVAGTANPFVDVNMNFDGVIELLSGGCGSLTSIGCADNNFSTGLESIASSGLTVGQTYYVRVYSWSTVVQADPTFTICVRNAPPPPVNDDCTGAISLDHTPDCEPTAGTIAISTQSIPAITCDGFTGVADDDVWYSFVAAEADTTHIDLNAGFDAVLELRDGDCNGGNTLDCSDTNFTVGLESIDYVGLTPGQTYYIRVYSWSGFQPADESFTICVYGANPAIDLPCGTTIQLVQTGTINGGLFNNYNVYEIDLSGAAAPFDFQWDNEGYVRFSIDLETNIVTVVTAANAIFTVTITDSDGCQQVISNGDNNDIFAITSYTTTEDDQTGIGAVDITVQGGSGSYSYEWSNGATTQDISGLSSGWYNVLVTDNGSGAVEEGWYWVAEDTRGRKVDMSSQMQIMPNPAINNTTISFVVGNNAKATVAVYDVTGKQVGNVYNGAVEANKVITVDYSTASLPSGIYTTVLTTNTGVVKQQKLVVVR
ncbi:MAG: pre-peptidase C-terminal domain-containing protein [Chitinophagales bacterium]|nr:pre-peptidase C-terminal domain-containing protein [Chitinophagales bacterium]